MEVSPVESSSVLSNVSRDGEAEEQARSVSTLIEFLEPAAGKAELSFNRNSKDVRCRSSSYF